MSEKTVKQQRKCKEACKISGEECDGSCKLPKQRIPAAGCRVCGSLAWAIELDQFPPNHTAFKAFHCIACGSFVPVHIPLDMARPLTARIRVPLKCPKCGNYNTTRFDWSGSLDYKENWTCWDCDNLWYE